MRTRLVACVFFEEIPCLFVGSPWATADCFESESRRHAAVCCGCAEVGVEGQTRSNSQRTAPACRCSRGCGPGGSAVCNCGRLGFARVTSSATGESQEGYSASDRKGSIALLCVVCLVRACAPPTLASVVRLPFAATGGRRPATRRGVEAEAGAFRFAVALVERTRTQGKAGPIYRRWTTTCRGKKPAKLTCSLQPPVKRSRVTIRKEQRALQP